MSHHAPLWKSSVPAPARGPLKTTTVVDVCVVGAGIAGLTTAYLLAKTGARVLVMEANEVASGETSRTTAHLASALDDRFHRLERLHGTDGARLAAESHAAAIDFIEQFSKNHDVPCDFRRVPGYLFAADDEGLKELDDEEIAARRAGLTVDRVDRDPLPWFRTGRCLSFQHQAQFSPLDYVTGLAREAEALGVRIFTGTRAATVVGGTHAHVVTTSGAIVNCRHVVVCTNVPVNDRIRLHTALEPYRSYVITLSAPGGRLEPALIWDTADPYHYVRVVPGDDRDLIVVGGEDHKTGQGPSDPVEPFHNLETWIRERAPLAGKIIHRWSGQIIEPVDDLALIGHNPFDDDNVFVITGDSGNGLTHGTLGGMIITDQIRGLKNPWEELYRPSRFRLGSSAEFAKHNVQVLGQYADWAKSADYSSIAEVPPGTAALVRHGLSKVAVHRDHDGTLQVCSAVCPHLGGLVRWNAEGRTWDCPCHGSRFAIDGTVINGPANTPLAKVEWETKSEVKSATKNAIKSATKSATGQRSSPL